MEMLYANDLILIAESEELLTKKVRIWKKGMEAKGLKVNLAKTKVLKCGVGCGQVLKEWKISMWCVQTKSGKKLHTM